MAKKVSVVLIGKSRGHEDGDVVEVSRSRADEMIATHLAREPYEGELDEAASEGEQTPTE